MRHTRAQVRAAAKKHRNRRAERMKWRGDFIPPPPYHLASPESWWEDILRRLQWKDRKPCSCWVCGLQRHGGKPSAQDLRDRLRAEVGIDTLTA